MLSVCVCILISRFAVFSAVSMVSNPAAVIILVSDTTVADRGIPEHPEHGWDHLFREPVVPPLTMPSTGAVSPTMLRGGNGGRCLGDSVPESIEDGEFHETINL